MVLRNCRDHECLPLRISSAAVFREPDTRADILERNRSGNLPETPAVRGDDAAVEDGRRGERRRRDEWSLFAFFHIFFNRNVRLFCTEQKYKLFMKDEVTAAASPPTLSAPAPPRAFTDSLSLAVAPQPCLPPLSLDLLRPSYLPTNGHKSSPIPPLLPLTTSPECRAR